MAPGSSKHPRDEESGPSRPHKASRVGEGTREQAIVLDDSDDNGSDLTLVEETSHPLKTEELPSRPLDHQGLRKHLKFALRLFDHEKKAPKRRSERTIVATKSQESVQYVQIKPKWVDGRLNVFFERSIPLSSGLNQYSHVSMNSGPATKFSDVASRIFECLDTIEDFFSIEFALYKTDADEAPHAGSTAAGQSIIRGDTPLSDILGGDDEVAIRVRLREYIKVSSDDAKDHPFAVTPGGDCTISQIREFAAAVWDDKNPNSMRLWVDDLELIDDSIPLVAWDLKHLSQISCIIETRECAICAEDIGVLAWPSRNTSTCTHEVHNCTDCIRNWIEDRLDNNLWDKITCLEDGCEGTYQAADVQLHATTEQNERFEHLSMRAALAKDPNFHWCIGPECENGQIHDGSGGNIFQCSTCGYRSCAECERPWHQGETCEQYTARLDAVDGNEAASAAFISTNTKECPSCKSRIQKDGGCDHMTCRKCRNQFCWICSADYREIYRLGNTAHAPTCQYHTGNIPDPHAMPLDRFQLPNAHGVREQARVQALLQAQFGRPQMVMPGPVFHQPPPAPFGQMPPGPQLPGVYQDPLVNQWLAGVPGPPPGQQAMQRRQPPHFDARVRMNRMNRLQQAQQAEQAMHRQQEQQRDQLEQQINAQQQAAAQLRRDQLQQAREAQETQARRTQFQRNREARDGAIARINGQRWG